MKRAFVGRVGSRVQKSLHKLSGEGHFDMIGVDKVKELLI
jgi:hypothetical protein